MPLPPLPHLKALPPQGRRACADVRRFLRRVLNMDVRGQRLLLAVSGGADSLALLLILAALRPSLGHALCAAHVNHGLRPESTQEEELTVRQCAAWGIPCVVRRIQVREYAALHGMGTEEAARELRYAALEEERRRAEAAWLCTGHHCGDLQEDLLLRLVRGTGWPALGGMAARDDGRRLCRPLLLTEPATLRELLAACKVVWAEDDSNADLRYTRNRMRHAVLPLLRGENPSFSANIRQLWHMARDDDAHWEGVLHRLLAAHALPVDAPLACLPATLLRQCDRATRMRLYMRALRSLGRGQGRAATLFALDAAWSEGRGGTVFQFPGKICARLRQGSVYFSS